MLAAKKEKEMNTKLHEIANNLSIKEIAHYILNNVILSNWEEINRRLRIPNGIYCPVKGIYCYDNFILEGLILYGNVYEEENLSFVDARIVETLIETKTNYHIKFTNNGVIVLEPTFIPTPPCGSML